MRSVPSYISERLKRNIQTRANGSAPSVDIWVGRPSTLLVDDKFLERQTVLQSKVSDVSIAVCHPRVKRNNTYIYMAYISGGVARVVGAKHKMKMLEHIWDDSGFEEEATAVSIAFDGTMPKANGGDVEFVTELYPWVFWVNETVLYGQKLYSDEEPVILAETNCTDVSAIRAMWSSTGGFDFGLVVFFILSGQLYYRQLIDGEWMDAELVSFGPDGVTWQEVAAFRTWDYRIGVQAKTTDGDVYELFTQFMGVGKQLTEHLAVDIKPKSGYTEVEYSNAKTDEHVVVGVKPTAKHIYGLSSVPVSAVNVDDGSGDYGTIIHVTFDYPISNADGNSANFSLVDGNGVTYNCTDSRSSEDGFTLILTFLDFNLAEGTTLTVGYIPGTVQSPAAALSAFEFTFTPDNLVAPDIPVPEPIEAWNVDAEGTEIGLRFSQNLVGDITGYETPAGYVQKTIGLSNAKITTLNQYSTSYTGAKVIDGSTSTYWRGTTAVNWIQFQLAEAKAVTKLRMYMGSYYIKTFTVSGSNDGSAWTQIGGTYTGASSATAKWYDFTLDNKTEYLYYRIDTLTAYSTRIYLYEVQFQETVPVGNENKISVVGQTYNYVPGGALQASTKTPRAVEVLSDITGDPEDKAVVYLKLNSGNTRSIRNMVGDVTLRYSGGTLRGLGGPVADFEFAFVPDGLEPKFHPHDPEHIEATVGATATLTRIYYLSGSESEHLEATVIPSGALTHVDDI